MAALNPTEYAWIIPPTSQFLDVNGKPLVGGYCVIYIHGTTGTPYTTYQNWEGTENPIEIPIDILGHAPAIGSVNYSYDLYLYDSLNALVYSRLNLGAYGDEGTFSIHTDSTLHGDGSVSDPLGVEKPEVIGGLVRGIVPESENVHVRTYQYLSDGSIMVGLRVDQTEYTAGPGIKIEDNVISLEDLGEFEGSLMVAEGSATSGTDLNTGMSVLKQEGDSVFVQQNVLKLNKGIYHVDAFIRFGALSNANEYDLTFLGHNGAKLIYTFDNTYEHSEVINFSFDADITEDNTPLTLTLNAASAPSAYSMKLEAIHVMKVIMDSGIGAIEYNAGAGIEIDQSTRTISTNFNTVQKKLTAGDNITIDQANGIISAADQVQADWDESDPDEKDYIKNKPENLVQDPDYVHTDNNFTDADKSKLAGIESGAEVNVNADWNATSGDAEILNKPENLVQDPNYVHTDNNYTTADKNKLAGIEAGAEVNVQADWSQSDSSADDYIKNKPTIYDPTFVATYDSTTYNDLKAAMDAKQQILLKTSAVATPIVPEMWGYGAGTARVVVLEYSSDSITRKTYSVTTQNVWSSTSEVIHANVDEVLTVTYNTISADTTGKMGSYYQDGKTIFLKIGSSAPFKWLPLYSLASGVYSFRDIQPTQDGKKLQAIDYQWNGTAWSTTTTNLLELKPGTVVLTTSNTSADIEAAIADGAVPLLFVGNATGGIYYQMVVRRVISTSYCYVFMRDPTEVGTNGSSDYCYVLSNSSSWNPYPNTNGSWAVHNEVYLKSDWDQIDSDSPDYIKNKPSQSPVAAGTDITLTEVNGTLYINSTAVPAHTSAESTKILSVDSNGNLVWVSPQSSTQVQADWNQSDSSAVDYIKNKPSIPVIGTITL